MRTNTKVVDGRAVIRLHGRFDFKAYRAFRSSCNPLLAASDVSELHVNLEEVEHLDRSALGMLLLLKARADEAAKRVFLTRCHGAVKQTLEGAKFDRIFSFA
jgi:anti-anti-sigma factor